MHARSQRVLGVLAGADFPLRQLADWARSADVVLAADGAADRLLEAGITPDATIGDLDSLRADPSLARAVGDADQETSDCDKLLAFAGRSGHREITLAGVEGNRLDHVLSTFSSAAKSDLAIRMIVRSGIVHVLRGPGTFVFASQPGEPVSLMPLERCADLDLTGVAWPLAGVELTALGQVSISNESRADHVEIRLSSGAAALFLSGKNRTLPIW